MLFRSVATVLLLLTTVLIGAPAQASSLTVRTDAGWVRGAADGEVRKFQGIPFARPPVGALRWRAPVPVRPWHGVRDATVPGEQCAQLAPAYGGITSYGEDCLYLNVTAPQGARRLPVMVWLHGGSNLTGRGSVYDAAKLATDGDVVVVTVNYRLGVFGWLAHPDLEQRRGEQAGNYGLLDQQAALRWVRANAGAFGGDPRNVTLFGESAGAEDTCVNMVSPAAKGLFHKAAIQSRSCATPIRTEATAEAQGVAVATAVGCADADCLRAAPAKDLVERFVGSAAGPVAGNALVPRQPADAIASGRFNRMPVVHGNTLDEMRLYISLQYPRELTVAEYEGIIRTAYGAAADAVLARYPAAAYPTPRIALATVRSHAGFSLSTCEHLKAYRLLDDARIPVYAYQFVDRTAPPLVDVPGFDEGAEHASELTFLWPGLLGMLTAEQERLSDTMVAYWTSFAHDGTPRARHAPRWPEFDRAADTLSLGLGPGGVRPADISRASNCAFWSGLS